MSYLDQITVGSTTYDIQDSNAQRKTIQGSGAPTTSTVGSIGDHYFNTAATEAPYEYLCVSVTSGVYTWVAVGSGGGEYESEFYYGVLEPTDPNVKFWMNPAGMNIVHEVPSGGSIGQFLGKDSDTDYDIKWFSIATLTNAEIDVIVEG